MSDGDYVLGTTDDEVRRLGIQHGVWRDRVLRAFRRARVRPGQIIIDAGAGPGFVSADLADIVGPSGRVVALERAPHFLEALRSRQLANIDAIDQDVAVPFAVTGADRSWCRWLLSFVPDPAATISHIAAALKPGGIAIFHEYVDYSTWRMMPPNPRHEHYDISMVTPAVAEIIARKH